jgi:hypothetical protein
MKKNTRSFVTLLVIACPWSLLAQTAVPAATTTTTTTTTVATPTEAQVSPTPSAASSHSTSTDQGEVTKLSPFEVSSERDTGYAATETLAGTRIRTNLDDVAASISVLNKNFLNDIGALDIGSMLQYTPSAEVAGTEGTYSGVGGGQTFSEAANMNTPQNAQRIRGLAAADNTRDYYITDIPWDTYNVDRVDILRGPNSFLFGLGSPAGIVNAGMANAEFRNMGEISERIGSYGSTRGTVDLNAQIIPDVLAIKIQSMYDDRLYEQSDAFQNQKRIYGALRFDPKFFKHSDFQTSLKMKVESGDISADRPRTLPPSDSITPWWNPNTISASNPYGGMGQQFVNNPYDPWRTTGITAANQRGQTQAGTLNFQPWLSDLVNQQQPYWTINGNTGQTLAVNGGYINVGAVDPSGNLLSASAGLQGKGTNGTFYGLTNLSTAALAYNLPGSQFGQYRSRSLEDPSVFNFYNTLIDGPTASQYEKWTAYNIDLSETGLDDRVGFDVSYDRQNYHRGNQALLGGGSPALTLDILKNSTDYYTTGADGETSITNPNLGRPYVEGAGNNGGGSYASSRQYWRGSLFGEVRASDFLHNDFLVKLLGKHRFNLVGSNEQFFNQTQNWQLYSNSQAWDGYWNGNNGASNSFQNRPPLAMIYLGGPVTGRSSAAGANIPGITAPVGLQSHGVYVFDSTWKATGTPYNAPWAVPTNLQTIYEAAPSPLSTTVLDQNSNPANYVGWNSNFVDNLTTDNQGVNPANLTLAQQSFRETISYAGSYQAYLWNNALVGTLGWRYDEVQTKDVTAQSVTLNRAELNVNPNAGYTLPNSFPLAQIFKGHSTAAGVVLHLNDLFKQDPLPINISGTFNDSKDFQVTSVRRDVYGRPISNPNGKTKEYGLMLSTKDGKFSLRMTKFDTAVLNGSSTLGNPGGVGTTVAQGLRYRNVFLYQLGGYTLDTANQPASRNNWNQAFPTETPAQAAAEEDAAITTWNNIQTHLAATGFFQAWNFNPTTPGVLTTRTQYLTNPSAYQPDPSTVSAYVATAPQGFTVTADTESKGYEYEAVYNPTRNWRIEVNAAENTAVQNNVGGAALGQLVTYLNSQLFNSDGSPTPAGKMPQFGNATLNIDANVFGPWLQNYTLLKLQEGSNVSELRKWRYNFVNNYTFDQGFLKGFSVGGAYRWQARNVIGYPISAAGVFDLSHPFYGPVEDGVDLWCGYTHRLTQDIRWKIQLNVTNAFARNGLIPVSVEPDGHTWAAARIKPIQEFAITNTFTY